MNTEYHSYKSRQNSPSFLLWFPFGFWGRQANFVATCSTEIQSERRPHRQEIWNGGEEMFLPRFIRGPEAESEFFLAGDANFPFALAPATLDDEGANERGGGTS